MDYVKLFVGSIFMWLKDVGGKFDDRGGESSAFKD